MASLEVVQKKSVSGVLKGLCNSIHRSLGKDDKRKFEELMETLEQAQSLAVSSLSISKIEEIFGVKRDKSKGLWALDKKSLEPVPEQVGKYIYMLILFFCPVRISFFFLDANKV
jgi:hypothetical protein